MTRRRPRHRGFTLVETIATIVILAAIGSVASFVLATATDGYFDASTRVQLHSEASIAMDRVLRELRNVELDTGASGVAPNIASVATSAITWNDDYALSVSGTDLLFQEDGAAAAVLAGDVSAFTISVQDESNATLSLPRSGTDCDGIRRVTVTLAMTRYGVTETVRSKIFLRSTLSGAGS